jgi:trans-2,3-dihydro-3-hydroxyanthranilate isomerase
MADALELLASFDPFASARERPGRAGLRPYLLVDVFTDAPLEGNQLAVVTDARDIAGEQMQRLARELNLSETVFVLAAHGEGDVRIRIFTPTVEMPFAGHPVLGCAIVVASALDSGEVTFETGAGAVSVAVERTGPAACFGRMRQPIPSWAPFEREVELLQALGVERSGLPVEVYRNGPRHVFVELAGEAEVAALEPDMRALLALGPLTISCFAGSRQSWKTRMFAPGLGVAEDPATGSAAGPLAVHLSRHGRIAFGEEIAIRQGEEIGRPSLLQARADGSAQRIERVEVGGSAVIAAQGDLLAAPGPRPPPVG